MSIENEQSAELLRKRSKETVEVGYETKEGKEADGELKAAAALERADYLVKEVKQSRKQMQNILLHMQQVMNAIRQLRAQLQLADGEEPSSVAHDKEKTEELKEKIGEYTDEIKSMRLDLIKEQVEELKSEYAGTVIEELQKKAELMIDDMIKEIE